MSFRFLSELYSPYPQNRNLLCEIRSLEKNRGSNVITRYFEIGSLESAAKFAAKQSNVYDVYMGVLPRYCKAEVGKAGTDAHVDTAAWLWCDIDRGDASDEDMIEFLGQKQTRMPRPRMVVLSGSGGAHLYWQLTTPHTMPEMEERKAFSALLRRLVLQVGFGPSNLHADKSCCNPSRILRVPNTYNHKRDTPAKVDGIICSSHDRLTFSEWDKLLPFEPLPLYQVRPKFTSSRPLLATDAVPPGLLRWAEAGYREGNRHHDMVGAAAWLRRSTDLPESVARDLFLIKAQNSPGVRALTPEELDSAWSWAS